MGGPHVLRLREGLTTLHCKKEIVTKVMQRLGLSVVNTVMDNQVA
jgi:hypothetical protein